MRRPLNSPVVVLLATFTACGPGSGSSSADAATDTGGSESGTSDDAGSDSSTSTDDAGDSSSEESTTASDSDTTTSDPSDEEGPGEEGPGEAEWGGGDDSSCCTPDLDYIEPVLPASCESPGGAEADSMFPRTYGAAVIPTPTGTIIRLSNSPEALCDPDNLDLPAPCDGEGYFVYRMEIPGELTPGTYGFTSMQFDWATGALVQFDETFCESDSNAPAIAGIFVEIESVEDGCVIGVLKWTGPWCCTDYPFVANTTACG